jgi:CRISPR/Cas system CSM-associated protein Csm2 small subunit
MLINKYNMEILVFSDDVSYIYKTIYKKEDSEIQKQIKTKAEKIYKKINNILQLVEVIDTLVNDINTLLTTINNTDLQIKKDSEYKENKQIIKMGININDIGHLTFRDDIDLEKMPWD